MSQGKLVFAQITQHLSPTTFCRCVARFGGEHKVKSFSCLNQYLCIEFAQLTFRDSLRDSEACLRARIANLYHTGIRDRVTRDTLADANEVRDWRIYAEFAQRLIGIARRLYIDEPFGVELKEMSTRSKAPTPVSPALADRTVLQVDQAASSDQGLLRNLPERGRDVSLDRGLGLRTRRYRHEAPEPARFALRNPTDREPNHVRTNAA